MFDFCTLWKYFQEDIDMEHWRENGLNSKLQETPAQVLSCEYCDNFKSTYFEKDLERAASLNPLPLVRYCKK